MNNKTLIPTLIFSFCALGTEARSLKRLPPLQEGMSQIEAFRCNNGLYDTEEFQVQPRGQSQLFF